MIGVEPHRRWWSGPRRRGRRRGHAVRRAGRPRCRCRTPASTSCTPAPRTSSAPAASPGWPRPNGCCGPAARSRSSTWTPPSPPYGDWMRADIPRYDPAAVERFFDRAGLLAAPGARPAGGSRTGRPSRRCCASSSPGRSPSGRSPRPRGLALPVGYRLHVRRKDAGRDRGALDAGAPPPAGTPDARAGHSIPWSACVRPAVPYLEPLVAAAWWTVGAAALDGGPARSCWPPGSASPPRLVIALRRRHGARRTAAAGRARPAAAAARLTAALVAVGRHRAGLLSGAASWPSRWPACWSASALMLLSSVLDERVAAGRRAAALMVLGAAGALLALDSAGQLYPQGVVGLVAGAAALAGRRAAHRACCAELRGARSECPRPR